MELEIPYGSGVRKLKVPDPIACDLLDYRCVPPLADTSAAIRFALHEPIGTTQEFRTFHSQILLSSEPPALPEGYSLQHFTEIFYQDERRVMLTACGENRLALHWYRWLTGSNSWSSCISPIPTPRRDVERAQVLWLYLAGESIAAIMRAVQMTRKSPCQVI